ncbi:MAG TPA: CPBP family intramembrane metalloprotease [Chlorobaculum parvum]|uniref:CPBP family intramembrane metalloprotease n=1 Tax=Chlorobaculum parvum TaxID=274539 RepID=A0A7C5HFC7_9CHLB|nr:CPBP family intramembrane metalloprotease [Chlorobaculum parvum]
MGKSYAIDSGSASLNERIKLAFGLMALIWLTGLVGHFTPLKEWPALGIYVIGGIGVVVWRGVSKGEWAKMYLAGSNLRKSLKWGGLIGGGLLAMALLNTVFAYKYQNGISMMSGMQYLLVNRSLLYLFPVLILAEEFLWRGLMLSALVEKGLNKHLAVFATTILFQLNHFAVAPVSMEERGLLAMMAFSLGLAGGYISASSRNVWGSVLLHLLLMVGMIGVLLVVA